MSNNTPSLPPLPPRPQIPQRNTGASNPTPPITPAPTNQSFGNYQAPASYNPGFQQQYPQQQAPQQQFAPVPPTPPTKSNKTLFIVLGAVVAVIVAAIFFLNPFGQKGSPVTPGENNGETGSGTSQPANPSKTTTYGQDPVITSEQPLNPDAVTLSQPSYTGYDGGTTYISFSDDTAWEPKAEAKENEDLTSRGYDALYRGFGACTMSISIVADGASEEIRWSGPGQEEENVKIFLASFFNSTADPSTFEKEDPIHFPSHADGKGQVPGYAYRIPAGETGQLADTYATLFFDYNTGRATVVGVACLTDEDSLGVYNEMINANNKFSVYIDVK